MISIKDLFNISSGNRLDYQNMVPSDEGVNFITRQGYDNGVKSKVELILGVPPYPPGAITVSLGGSKLLSAFVQPYEFYTAQNVAVLIPKNTMTMAEKMFYCTCISYNRFRYSAFGREANRTFRDIELPDVPENIKHFPVNLLKDSSKSNIKLDLSFDTWKTFIFDDIFDIKDGFYNKKPDHTFDGNIPFLSATKSDNGYGNGVVDFYSMYDIEVSSKNGDGKNSSSAKKVFPGGAVCVTNNGSVGYAYYQAGEFTCSHDVTPLYPKNGTFSLGAGLFVATVIQQDRYRWSYNRKWRPARMKFSTVSLPANSSGDPDWVYMEKYIYTLPYSQYLNL